MDTHTHGAEAPTGAHVRANRKAPARFPESGLDSTAAADEAKRLRKHSAAAAVLYSPARAAHQRSRLRAHLEARGSVSTIEAREELRIFHPAARVLELRDEGFDILTAWDRLIDATGAIHRIARYVWRGRVAA